jgi:hypothetical protein
MQDEEFFIITKKQVRNLKKKLENSTRLDEAKEDLEKMLEIKKTLLWRSDVGGCCSVQAVSAQLSWEVQTIENALNALKEKDISKVASLLEEYEKYSLIPEVEGEEVLCRF